jgi:hypothetical protein
MTTRTLKKIYNPPPISGNMGGLGSVTQPPICAVMGA